MINNAFDEGLRSPAILDDGDDDDASTAVLERRTMPLRIEILRLAVNNETATSEGDEELSVKAFKQ